MNCKHCKLCEFITKVMDSMIGHDCDPQCIHYVLSQFYQYDYLFDCDGCDLRDLIIEIHNEYFSFIEDGDF